MTVRRETAQPRRDAPIATKRNGYPALRREGGSRIGDPLLCLLQRVNNTVTD
ncbi:MAG: hypothetical protein AABY90_10025 [Nitrospirota bacterium]|jgi:hypothetical protein